MLICFADNRFEISKNSNNFADADRLVDHASRVRFIPTNLGLGSAGRDVVKYIRKRLSALILDKSKFSQNFMSKPRVEQQ